jgi:hypothetical protein
MIHVQPHDHEAEIRAHARRDTNPERIFASLP